LLSGQAAVNRPVAIADSAAGIDGQIDESFLNLSRPQVPGSEELMAR
jgi:hypothetical protein